VSQLVPDQLLFFLDVKHVLEKSVFLFQRFVMNSSQLTSVLKHITYTTFLVGVGVFVGIHYSSWLSTLSPYFSRYLPLQLNKKEYQDLMESANEHCPGLESEKAGTIIIC
jgi:hypothetical protein